MSLASTSERTDVLNIARGFAAGALATVVSKSTTAPLDRVKLLLQLQNRVTVKPNLPIASNRLPYNGIIDCSRRLLVEEGVLSLWRGNSATVFRVFPSNALNFVLRDYYRLVFLKDVDRKKNYGRFVLGNILAGGFGGVTSLCCLYPLDVARTKLAVETKKDGSCKFRGITHCLRHLFQTEGVAGIYRGFVVSVQFVAISRSIFFGMFDTIRSSIAEDPKKLNFATVWFIAQTCVVTSSFISYPFDTIRRQMMLQAGKSQKMYAGSMDFIVKTLKTDGYSAFYRGAVSNSLKSTSAALMVSIYYEAIKYI
ncbi:ADP/ATP translocase [Aphelenchoides besseyi]|nr:ADP/ATP translocase [Aphelenchoides besseyi]